MSVLYMKFRVLKLFGYLWDSGFYGQVMIQSFLLPFPLESNLGNSIH